MVSKNGAIISILVIAILLLFYFSLTSYFRVKPLSSNIYPVNRIFVVEDRSIPLFSQRNQISPSVKIQQKLKADNNHVLLFVAIISYVDYFERRTSVRNTWLIYCKQNKSTVCRFIIDGYDQEGKQIAKEKQEKLDKENKEFGDLAVLDSFEGINFAYRLYRAMMWADEHYKFDFFLRIDDDYFLCFERLIYELPYRKNEKYLYWGYEHVSKTQSRMDDGFTLFGKDLMKAFVKNKEKLVCHTFADQVVPLWFKTVNVTSTWFHDKRIKHYGGRTLLNAKSSTNVCAENLAVHEAYKILMRKLHNIDTDNKKHWKQAFDIPKIKDPGKQNHQYFKIEYLLDETQKTKLCIERPFWTAGKRYYGREDAMKQNLDTKEKL